MKIGIIGAGIAGLTCAWYLKKEGIDSIVIFESSDKAGGKLRTDQIGAYQLDRGFQVLLPGYPEAKKILDYEKLDLQKFDKGSLIFKNKNRIPFYDPENGISALLKTIIYGPGTLVDKLLLLKLKIKLNRLSSEKIFESKKSISSKTYLKEFGFSDKMIQDFWIPFYQGVFIEDALETDSKMLLFTFKMFAEAGAAIPKEGMEAIPKQLVSYIGAEKIKLKSKVINFDNKSITTEDGSTQQFDVVILACNLSNETKYNSVTNKYYEADKLPINTKHVMLNANENRTVNNVVFISNIAPDYSKNGKHLISVSANGIHESEVEFRKDLKSMFGEEINKWKLIKKYTNKEAIPTLDFNQKNEFMNSDGIYCCGDYLVQGSINGAMESGRKLAEELIRH